MTREIIVELLVKHDVLNTCIYLCSILSPYQNDNKGGRGIDITRAKENGRGKALETGDDYQWERDLNRSWELRS